LHLRLRCWALFAAALACALASQLRPAQACTWAVQPGAWTPEAYQVDPELRATDKVAPSAFTKVRVFAYRSPAEICDDDTCTLNTCGDSAAVELSFVSPTDDQTPSDQLGYRIEVLAGEIPESMRDGVGQPRPLTSGLLFAVNFNEVTKLDAVIALVAIDRAGNESAPSAPIRIRYSGCTKHPGDQTCIEDEAGDCSIASMAPGKRSSPRPGLPLLAVLGLALLLGARRRR
jgi:MYXO-CTERM domain-containing protein